MTVADLTFDDAAVAEAEAALAALAEEYPGYAEADVAEMARLAEAIYGKLAAGESVTEDIGALFSIAHNVKGQGSSFGYDLMTVFGDTLCDMLRDRSAIAPDDAARVASLVGACRTVLRERLTGMGGERGADLIAAMAPQHQR